MRPYGRSVQHSVAGPDYRIGAELGRQAGSNLFHSFERFGLRTGEHATVWPGRRGGTGGGGERLKNVSPALSADRGQRKRASAPIPRG